MGLSKRGYNREEVARLGDEIYERDIEPRVESTHQGKFVAIDVETGAYELDRDELVAVNGLRARLPNAQVWLRRVGSPYAHRIAACNSSGREW